LWQNLIMLVLKKHSLLCVFLVKSENGKLEFF
jgi:hypothetical protein